MDDLLQPAEGVEKTKRLIAACTDLGLGGPFAVLLATMAGIKMTADQRHFLEGPVIVHLNGWTDSVPKWLTHQAVAERALIVFGLQPKWIVGPSEICAVMMPAMHEHPMQHDSTMLYLWASATACSKHYRKPIESYWEQLGVSERERVRDEDVLEPNGRYHHDYRSLCDEILRKVIQHAPKMPKGPQPVTVITPKPALTERPIVEVQLDFFK